MPHRLSLVRRLAGLRSRFTAESTSTVRPDMVHALSHVDATTRRQLRAALDDCSTPIPADVRQLVLPDAATPEQRSLEAGILRVASQLVPTGFRMVRPLPDQLILHTRAEARVSLLAALVPRETPDGLVGVAGLRVRPFRRHVDLYLAGTTAHVSLAAVSHRMWQAAFADDDPARLSWWQRSPMTTAELSAIADEQALASAVASSLLRRIGLFPSIPAVTAPASDVCQVDWPDGESTSWIAAALTDPLCGLPGVPSRIAWLSDHHLTIPVSHGAASVALSGPDLSGLN